MKKYFNTLKSWSGYAAIITLVCGIIYITVQQNYRLSANDPQYQLTEDAANALNAGADPKSLPGTASSVEISQSLSPYLIIYNQAGRVVAGHVTLNNKTLIIPPGVLSYIQKHGSDAATWQPAPGVRQAMVAKLGKSYIAISGRSLRKVEERISLLGEQVLFGWGLSLLAMLVVVVLQEAIAKRMERKVN